MRRVQQRVCREHVYLLIAVHGCTTVTVVEETASASVNMSLRLRT